MDNIIAECHECRYQDNYLKVLEHITAGCSALTEDSQPETNPIESVIPDQIYLETVEPLQASSSAHVPQSTTGPYIWTEAAVSLLITEFRAHKDEFELNHQRKKPVWIKVTKKLLEKNIPVNSGQVENKWKHMVNNYKIAKDKNRTSGEARHTCLRYAELDQIFSKSPTIIPVSTASNLNSLSSDNEDDPPPKRNRVTDGPPPKRNRVTEKVPRHRSQPEPAWMKAWRDDQKVQHAEKLAALEKIRAEEVKFNKDLLEVLRAGTEVTTTKNGHPLNNCEKED